MATLWIYLVVASLSLQCAKTLRATARHYQPRDGRGSDGLTSFRSLLIARPEQILTTRQRLNSDTNSRIRCSGRVQSLLRLHGGSHDNDTNTTIGIKRVESNIDYVKQRAKLVHKLIDSHREIALVVVALLGLLYGGSIPFTVLFLQSFGKTGLPVMRKAVRRAKSAYAEARYSYEPLRRQLVDLAAKLAKLRREGASDVEQEQVIKEMRVVRQQLQEVLPSGKQISPVIVAMHEPSVVRDLILGLWSGIILSLSAACHSAARTLGVGISLGEFVSKAGTVLLAKAELALRKKMSTLPGEAVMLAYLGPSLAGAATIGLLGRWVGFCLARRLQNLAVILSVSLHFARMLFQAIEPFLNAVEVSTNVNRTGTAGSKVDMKKWQETLVWILAVGAMQNQRSRNFRLPLILKILFLPALGIEAVLQELANQLNSHEGFPFLTRSQS